MLDGNYLAVIWAMNLFGTGICWIFDGITTYLLAHIKCYILKHSFPSPTYFFSRSFITCSFIIIIIQFSITANSPHRVLGTWILIHGSTQCLRHDQIFGISSRSQERETFSRDTDAPDRRHRVAVKECLNLSSRNERHTARKDLCLGFAGHSPMMLLWDGICE